MADESAPDVPWIDIGDGITIPPEVSARASIQGGLKTKMTAVYDPAVGRYRVTQMTISASDGHEITGELLRTIKVADDLRLVTQGAVAHRMARWPKDLAANGPTVETLKQVALIYRLALLLGDAPTQAVSDQLGVPRSTAGRWVTRARDRGFLTVVDPRASRGE
jgi:hypothetical protein